jgi:hypothetical protein
MPTEKAKEDRVQKVRRSIDLDETLSDYIALAQEKRNEYVTRATKIAQDGEAALRSAVEKVFKKSEVEIPTAQVQLVKNPETGLTSLTWEEATPKDDDESAFEGEPSESEEEPVEKAAGVNGAAKRPKLPAKG